MGSNWIFLGFVSALVAGVVLVRRVLRAQAEREKAQKEDEARKRKRAEVDYGNLIRRALEEVNRGGRFAIEGNWLPEHGYVLEIYRLDERPSDVKPVRIVVNTRDVLKALVIKKGEEVWGEFNLSDASVRRVIQQAKSLMESKVLL